VAGLDVSPEFFESAKILLLTITSDIRSNFLISKCLRLDRTELSNLKVGLAIWALPILHLIQLIIANAAEYLLALLTRDCLCHLRVPLANNAEHVLVFQSLHLNGILVLLDLLARLLDLVLYLILSFLEIMVGDLE
jgi:hypothetical protein